jgi:hypothetical protein
MAVVVISGPPCAGKTYYAREHVRYPGDSIMDRDEMGGAAYERAMSLLRAHGYEGGTAYVVACLPGETARAAFVAGLRARHVHLAPPIDVLTARARARPNPRREIAAVRAWQQRERADAPRRTGAVDPPATVQAWWE